MIASLTTSMTEGQHTIQQIARRFSRERLAAWRGSGKDGLTADRCGKQVCPA